MLSVKQVQQNSWNVQVWNQTIEAGWYKRHLFAWMVEQIHPKNIEVQCYSRVPEQLFQSAERWATTTIQQTPIGKAW